jgi:uncharacterized protein YdeI (YjbR/CyaY-like superfamily)
MKADRKTPGDLPVIGFAGQKEWEAWLDQSHAISPGIWIKLAKKSSGHASVSYAEAVETALCYGWIDGQSKSLDGSFYLQKFTPRRPKSIWSKINREKAEQLIRSGRMKPAGLEAVERAKQDGRWEAAYESPSQAGIPPDLQTELDRNPPAKAFFETLDSRNRYAILYRLQTTKKAETRARRIEQFIQMLANQEKLYP